MHKSNTTLSIDIFLDKCYCTEVMQLIQEPDVRDFIQSEFDIMGFCTQRKKAVNIEHIVTEIMISQPKQIQFAEKNKETSPALYGQERLESSVRFKIRKMIEMDFKKNSAPTLTV